MRDIIDPVAKLKKKILDEKLEENKTAKIIKEQFSPEIKEIKDNICTISKKTGLNSVQVMEIIVKIVNKGKGGSLCCMMI